MSLLSLSAYFALVVIGSLKVASFVVAVRRALVGQQPSGNSRDEGEDGGGYWPDWQPGLWPIQPRSGSSINRG